MKLFFFHLCQTLDVNPKTIFVTSARNVTADLNDFVTSVPENVGLVVGRLLLNINGYITKHVCV